ncbi:kinesin heavy chain-like [Parasteatoda tepidariorum]|uniref:kinesin heavy chain-like n=1 Tax=Parasteatoda tepidariorum TaxID=114398 RepID=UPI0039BD81D9
MHGCLSSVMRTEISLEKTKDLPPYRESCLTRLLKESLGGNSQTAIIVCIRPSSECETKYSLEFGTRAKIIRNSLQLNVKLSGNRLSRFWDRLQRSIRSTNKYIKGSVTELQRWRSGESVPEEEWIPLFDCGEGDSLSESALLDTSDCAHSVQNMSNSQILSDSSIMNTSSCDINSSSTLQDCEDISGLIRQVEIMKKQFQQLSLGNTKSKHVKSEEANNTDERQADEMIKLKEELAFYKERNLIHHQGMETVTQELKLQEIRCNELSSKLIAETGKSKIQEAKAERRMRDIRRCRKVLDEYLEVFSKKNSQKSIACSLKPLSEICPSIDDKLRRITGEDLKSTLHAENIQDQIFRMYFKLQGMTNFRVEQEQKIATVTSERDSAIENNMSLQEELYNLSISHAAMGQALKVSMVDKLQHLKIEGLQESLFEGCVQNGVMKLCDQLIGLYEKCDQQEKKIAAISEERDILGQSLVFAGIDMDNLRKTHESEKKLSDAKIDSMSDEIETLHLELEKERSRGSHCSYINHRLREENEANEVKINSLEEELFTERVLNEEETSRMELLLLEKANAESLLAARLCCSDKRNQIIVEEFKKRVGDLMVLFKNFLDKFNVPPFDDADLEENAVVEGNTTFVKNGSSEDLNNNEVLTSDLFLDKTSTEEVHFETLSGSFSGNAEPSPGIKETGEVTENFKVEELVLDSEWYRPVW